MRNGAQTKPQQQPTQWYKPVSQPETVGHSKNPLKPQTARLPKTMPPQGPKELKPEKDHNTCIQGSFFPVCCHQIQSV